jgi:hypothetical protein
MWIWHGRLPPPMRTEALCRSPLSDLAGYLVYYGTQSGTYSSTLDVGNMTSHTISISDQEALGNTYYFAVTALDASIGNL